MEKKLALFDFDGTITTKDTLLELGKFHKGKFLFVFYMILLLPWLILMKAGVLVNWKVKERYLKLFFGGMDEKEFSKLCKKFASNKLPELIRPLSLVALKKFRDDQYDIYIVSASVVDWIQPWAQIHGIQVIATELEKKEGKITGKLNGINCHGTNKVTKIQECLNLDDYKVIEAFGDSSGDKQMLAIATKSYYRPFRN